MLVSYEWLSQYVDLEGISPEDIAEEMNRTGIEVEVIYTRDPGVNGVVVGEVLAVEPHPEADRLNICTVNVGKGQLLQIVCGAKNVAAGQRVPVALIGAKLPGGVHIKKAKLRGVESHGMICSAKELGFPDKVLMKEQTEGIFVLEPDAPVGMDIKEYLSMDDQVIELQLTPNRSDCLGMWGVAHEVAAIFDRELRLPVISEQVPSEAGTGVEVVVESVEDCPFYAAQVVGNLEVGPSPQWMQNRLISAGIRPINNIVDITNYVMLETGQPLHAFDFDKIANGQILVRRANDGEKIVTLDDVERECDPEMLLVTDGQEPLAVAGVMGGASSEVTKETKTVLLEAAFFNPLTVRQTSKNLGLRSEASTRFEKGVDPEQILPALYRAVQLLRQLCGGVVSSDASVHKAGDVEEVTISLRHERLVNLLGVQISPDEVMDIFRRLRLPAEFENDVYQVQIPTRRPDLMMEVDLVEEVARLYGYDRIPATLPWGQQLPGALTKEQKLRRDARHMLRELGLNEVVTYSLTSDEAEQEIASLYDLQPIRVAMPMSKEHAVLRTTLLPQLIKVAAYNVHRGNERVQLFEVGKVYLTQEETLTDLPEERLQLAALIAGPKAASIWKTPQVDAQNFYELKGILESVLERFGVRDAEYQAADLNGFHPGRTALCVVEDEVIGVLGQLHPKLSKEYDLSEPVVLQLDLEKLLKKDLQVIYEPIPRYPAVTRDLAVTVDENVPAGRIEAGIRKVAGELLESVTLFDVFTGEQIGEGKKSVAYSLVFRTNERTLTDEEVHQIHERIVHYLTEQFGAQLRQ
ncbi:MULTISPECIES: phenylalanine--tRNA ligase subunit beta [unclassified Thermoactinomyces]|jgi:phenylalanyl-tRNA synthetase beta chain|uniref:phenylalanine--tRNA ligase subunit beta n=1 Tax=unclassified Thermoactinomyces TaxID=2634588 RepID=UPI00050853D3|nr:MULTISPECIES: phenylalanine--tRNA ligase subunit beta [unclassified Thermoactinomyces]KFZ41354.1 phenylalanyl-tRNA synthase subunit beta [Thermoactinomyces sp. Gus2-1]KYQ87465.1 phenylalanine--tRNA ligase subunit beta [Thermoactinomyces sp. AS95]MBH8585311.1 phenylalanine--tRNA ligase subunit beta [Thermoactinomyces sp. CICC 10520]MBI0385873.1 phenylalanine--tRNA ligase subunit beta [Thermoactinomyces sp. CICC 24227]